MNSDDAQQILSELGQIRKLLELLAEPAIAERDAKLRDELRKIVGSSPKNQKSLLSMDGVRNQSQIVKMTAIDKSNFSKMIIKLDQAGLLSSGRKQPKLAISIPSNFFNANPERK